MPSSIGATAIKGGLLIVFAVLADAVTIVSCFIGVNVTYNTLGLQVDNASTTLAKHGSIFAATYLFINFCCSNYTFRNYIFSVSCFEKVQTAWGQTFMLVLTSAYFLKETSEFSRVTVLLVYLIGFLGLVALRSMITACFEENASSFQILRILIIGTSEELQAFNLAHQPATIGIHVAASAVLHGKSSLPEDLALAIKLAQVVRPDRVYVLSPTSVEVVSSIVCAFLKVPAALHFVPRSSPGAITNVSNMDTKTSNTLLQT